MVVLDDLGHSDLGIAGSHIRTPVLDSLAHEGAILDNYHVHRACSPTRAALMTGRYPIRYGLQSGVLEDAKPYGLALNETLLPELLNSAGWRTHMVGKWHLGHVGWNYTPTFRGYESFYGLLTGGADHFSHQSFSGGYDLRDDRGRRCGANCSRVAWEAAGQYSTHLFTERAVEIIGSMQPAENLFLYLAYQAVHCPAQAPPEYSAPYSFPDSSRNVFAGMLAAVDEGVGNVTAALHRAQRWDTTLFIVTSDNGAPTPGGRAERTAPS
jgi:arylsulfatase A-like enzyme